jgi:hypothetical protein
VGDAFSEQVKLLTAQHVSNSRFNDVVDAYTGASKAKEGRGKTIADRKVKVLKDLWKHDERVAPWKNSAYGVLAAFNTAQHHYFGTEKTRVERNQQHVIEGKWNQFDDNVLRLLAAV